MKAVIKSTIAVAIMTLSFCSAVAQQQVPIMEKGTKTSVLFNKKGTKRLDIEVLDIIYSDSTYNKCKTTIKFQFTAIGKEIPLFKYEWLESRYHPRLKFSYNKDLPMEKLGKSLAENQSIVVDAEIFLEEAFFVQFDDLYLMGLNKYEGGKIIKQREEEKRLALQRQREIEENKRKAEQQKRDSINAQYDERRKLLLTPPYLANWVGVNFFTKENIEKDCGVSPVAYYGGAVMYSFPLCGVTMEFEDTHHVCVSLSFRLYGQMGYDMKKELIEYGYKLQSQSKDLIAENNYRDLTDGKRSVYKCKLKGGDYSNCIILEGQAMMFTFYRTKK